MVKKKVGIAGYGIIGKRRRQYIDNNPHLQTIAVCDQNLENDTVLEDGLQCFSNYQHLLEEPLDALFISMPNYLAPENILFFKIKYYNFLNCIFRIILPKFGQPSGALIPPPYFAHRVSWWHTAIEGMPGQRLSN